MASHLDTTDTDDDVATTEENNIVIGKQIRCAYHGEHGLQKEISANLSPIDIYRLFVNRIIPDQENHQVSSNTKYEFSWT